MFSEASTYTCNVDVLRNVYSACQPHYLSVLENFNGEYDFILSFPATIHAFWSIFENFSNFVMSRDLGAWSVWPSAVRRNRRFTQTRQRKKKWLAWVAWVARIARAEQAAKRNSPYYCQITDFLLNDAILNPIFFSHQQTNFSPLNYQRSRL